MTLKLKFKNTQVFLTNLIESELTLVTQVKGEIKTNIDNPVYSKVYTFKEQIDGKQKLYTYIRPSRSPYMYIVLRVFSTKKRINKINNNNLIIRAIKNSTNKILFNGEILLTLLDIPKLEMEVSKPF